MLLFALSDVRDLVIVVWGIVSILLTLILLAAVVAILYLGRKGMTAVHGLLKNKGVPQLDRLQAFAVKLEERSARLPGAPGSEAGAGELITAARELQEMDPPFRRRIKSWRPL